MLAFVFPGQGSQSLGMLSELAEQHHVIQDTFAEASDALGYDLWQLCQQGPEEQLNETQHTQPAVLTAGVALWRLWQTQSPVRPTMMAGHSLGEYTALVCADSLVFIDAVKLVALRGELMQKAVPAGTGSMAAIIGLDNSTIEQLCQQACNGEIVSPANFNAIGQTVVAGHTAAVQRLVTLAKEAGAKKAVVLAVSVPSHSPLMQPAADKFAKALNDITITAPEISVIQNVDVQTHDDPDAIAKAMIAQLSEPVRWVETIQTFAGEGIRGIIECGPGKVLTGLIKRIDRELTTTTTFNSANFTAAIESVTEYTL